MTCCGPNKWSSETLVRWNVQGLAYQDYVWVGQLIVVQYEQAAPVGNTELLSDLAQGVTGLDGVVLA